MTREEELKGVLDNILLAIGVHTKSIRILSMKTNRLEKRLKSLNKNMNS